MARLAGLPQAVVERARALLGGLSGRTEGLGAVGFHVPQRPAPAKKQLSLFPPQGEELRQELLALDPENLTPFDALLALKRLVEKARGE